MEPDWKKADFTNAAKLEDAVRERLRLVYESFARDLGINLSAFLRTSITAAYSGVGRVPYAEFSQNEDQSCFAAILTKPDQHRLVLRADYSVLFPLIGIALGAKSGAFVSPGRKPTEIELQVVTLLFRLVLSETYRVWASLLKNQLETLALEIEPTPSRILPGTELLCAAEFDLTVGEASGKLRIAAPPTLFSDALSEQERPQEPYPEPVASVESTLELMMPARVAIDVWLDASEIRLGDLLQLREGQIVKLEHAVEQRVDCTLNGQPGFEGQVVSTGAHRAFLIEDFGG
ncbi:MAG TPA: FliM/FliN family flagellar motor switch protein [Bryobacteraceae bacterium]|nr:FliM/FliN family flagellar motor switch protein [Bryobacteraceae bacterium]